MKINARLAWKDSSKVYSYRKLFHDLTDMGQRVSLNGVARLARLAGIHAQIGYKKKPTQFGGKPSVGVANTLDRQFNVNTPDKAWVTDITYIRTYEGFAHLCAFIDLYSRRAIGWALKPRPPTEVALQALLIAIWKRKPKTGLLIHSDQGTQFTSRKWAAFFWEHKIKHSNEQARQLPLQCCCRKCLSTSKKRKN